MKFFKKMHKTFLILCLMVLGMNFANAATVEDVKQGFWAANAIVDCINRGYLTIDSNYKFYPNGLIKRGEFLNALLKVIESENIIEGAKAYFKDVNETTKYSNDIAISQRLGMVFGYPDKTFKPEEAITHSEATSVIANISKTSLNDTTVLEKFADAGTIPLWALDSYAKVVEDGLYVNYPDPSRFNPASKMTRAEAAVLFAKMAGDMDALKAMYPVERKIQEVLLSEETMQLYGKAPRSAVKIYNTKKVIEAGNVIVAHPRKLLDTRKVENGAIIDFVAPADVYTEQGTLLYSKGTVFSAKVHEVKNRVWIEKQAKALFIFDTAKYNNGIEKEMAAVPFTTDKGNVIFVTNANSKKEKKARKELTRGDFLLKYVDRLIPIVKTEIKPNQDIYLLLTGDLIIPEKIAL